MYILDTNIISELVRPQPNPGVVDWINARATTSLYTTSITKAELYFGIGIMSEGKRKQGLQQAIDTMLRTGLQYRVLGFSETSAIHFAEIAAQRTLFGRPISTADAQIAAICREHRFTLVTRNTPDFMDCGIELLNPFTD